MQTHNYLAGAEDRIIRRVAEKWHRRPGLMIEPLDLSVRSIGRGHLGLWMGPPKSGKSLALIWVATSYLFHGLNVLFFTLEDPLPDVEDRFDACIAEMPIADLNVHGERFRQRFEQFRSRLRSQLRIVDGTDGSITISTIESIWERERDGDFPADAVIIDYDDEIRPQRKQSERRLEFADIYRDLRQFVARTQVIGWTAAQAQRRAEDERVISGKMIAEDISKIRKVTMAIGIGRGDWGENSRYLYIAAHRLDRQRTGMNIMTAPERGVFFDREPTVVRLLEERRNQREDVV